MEICQLPDVPLFRGLTEAEAETAITALRMRRKAFAKGEILLEAGQCAPALGVVLAGCVHMEHLDVWGSKTLLGQAGPGDLFAETYACLPEEPLLVSAVAAEGGEALFLETEQLLQCGCEPCRGCAEPDSDSCGPQCAADSASSSSATAHNRTARAVRFPETAPRRLRPPRR